MTTPPASDFEGPPSFGWALVGAAGAIIAADAKFATLLGVTRASELRGRDWRDLVAPESRAALAEIEEAVASGGGWRGRVAVQTADGAAGGRVHLDVEASPRGDASTSLRVVGATSIAAIDRAPRPAPSIQVAPPPLRASEPAEPSERAPSLRAALERAAGELGFELAVVLRVDDGGRTIEVVEAHPEGIAGGHAGVRWSPPDAAERAVIESGEPAIEGALAVRRGDVSPLARLGGYGLRSAVRVPLFSADSTDGKVAGIVAAYSRRANAFSIEDALRLERAIRGVPLTSAPAPAPAPAPASAPAAPPSMAERFDRLSTLGDVMAGVAHELNNPLTAVVGYAQALRSLPPSEQARAVEIIEREALRAGSIVHNLLTFAQRHPPALTAVDLNAVVQRVLDLKRYALQMDNVAIEVEHAPLPELHADEHQLEQALLNLVNNAHQAMTSDDRASAENRPGGTLRVRTYLEGGRARVAVEDSGPGVPPEDASRVFDPFFTTRGVGGGAGLGLAVVFGTVAAHGGRVWVEPAPSGGARFVIELPVAGTVEAADEPPSIPRAASEPAAPAAPAPAGPPRGAGERVLIVDDEESIRVLASQVLTSFGYAPSTAASATEALSLLEEGAYDAIITDIRMPGMDGVALYHEVARRWPQLASRVLIMTGDVENEAVATLLRERGLQSLEKPFRLEALLTTLATVLRGAPRSS